MIIDLSTRDYGDIAPLVKATSGLLSAAWAVYFGFRGRNKAWEPPKQPLESALARISAVGIAVGIAAVWYQLTDPSGAAWLVRLWWPAVLVTIVTFLIYGLLLKLLVHNRKFSMAPKEISTEKIVGGLWKTKDAKREQRESTVRLTADELLWTMESNPDLVWSDLSQGLAQLTLNLAYLLLIISGAGALTCAGAMVLAAQTPRIQQFITTPARISRGDVTTISWLVVNAKSVTLDPIGDVPSSGDRAVRPVTDTAYTLIAKNSFATIGVQQSVVVAQAAPVPKLPGRRTQKGATSAAGSTVLQARDCQLVRNVVIRGEGWLQNEQVGSAEANCIVQLSLGGLYEIFVDYASPESRPVRIALNSKIIAENGLAAATGGAGEMNRLDQSLGVYATQSGANILQIYSEHAFPYIRKIRFQRMRDN